MPSLSTMISNIKQDIDHELHTWGPKMPCTGCGSDSRMGMCAVCLEVELKSLCKRKKALTSSATLDRIKKTEPKLF